MSRSHLFVVGSIGGLLLWVFAPTLGGGQTPAFRDAAHFYHPLFEYVRGEWSAGRVPLWNPYENLGLPLAADTTSSVFYPGKLIFLLPGDFTLVYNAYIAGHVALAALACCWLARHWGASVPAAGLAGVSYAFSGSVLFQAANVVYLVGAAWLPVAMLLADRALRGQSWRAAVGLGVVLALVVTGGDPQMAYNAGLLAALYALLLWRAGVACSRTDQAAVAGRFGRVRLLAIAAITCVLLAAVQIVPAWQATRLSQRAAYDAPRNVYELAAWWTGQGNDGDAAQASWYEGLVGRETEGHARAVYEFSVGPWRVIELLWPNVAGRQFPTHRRWLEALPAEGRVWTPSLYMGLLPVVLALAAWSVRRAAPVEVRWMSWTVVLAGVASMGGFGLVWWVREVTGWFGTSPDVAAGGEVGGPYWLMTVLLPGYVYFRYPAKLLVVAALGLSLLAARGWDQAWTGETKGLRRLLIGAAVASGAGLVAVGIMWPRLSDVLAAVPADPVFGPFDAAGAWRDVVGGLAQTMVVSLVLLCLAWPAARASGGRIVVAAALLVTVVELAIAQAWLVPVAPAELWNFEPSVVAELEDGEHRVFRPTPWLPSSWRTTSSVDRIAEIVRWDRETLAPRYPLPDRLSLVDASSTIAPLDYRTLLDVARGHGEASASGPLPHDSVLDLLGADVALMPRHAEDQMAVDRRATALPRAWIVHRVEVLPPLATRSPAIARRRTEEVLFPAGLPRDWRSVAVVETDVLVPNLASDPSPAGESCRIVRAEPSVVEIEARLASPGLVVLADAFAPGWTLTVESQGKQLAAPIVRANRVMRGALLPAGSHRLVYRYRPVSVFVGGAVSALTVIVLVAVAVRWVIGGRGRSPGEAGG